MTLPHVPLTQAELQRIKETAERATPGPWQWYAEDFSMAILCQNADPFEGHVLDVALCKSCEERAKTEGAEEWSWGRCSTPTQDNAAFIASSRTDVPRLVAEIERLRAVLRETEKRLTRAGFVGSAQRINAALGEDR